MNGKLIEKIRGKRRVKKGGKTVKGIVLNIQLMKATLKEIKVWMEINWTQ